MQKAMTLDQRRDTLHFNAISLKPSVCIDWLIKLIYSVYIGTTYYRGEERRQVECKRRTRSWFHAHTATNSTHVDIPCLHVRVKLPVHSFAIVCETFVKYWKIPPMRSWSCESSFGIHFLVNHDEKIGETQQHEHAPWHTRKKSRESCFFFRQVAMVYTPAEGWGFGV
jgi:hypothetical protein